MEEGFQQAGSGWGAGEAQISFWLLPTQTPPHNPALLCPTAPRSAPSTPRPCSQPRLEGQEFCIKHILEDRNAPFKQCSYVSTKNGKRLAFPPAFPVPNSAELKQAGGGFFFFAFSFEGMAGVVSGGDLGWILGNLPPVEHLSTALGSVPTQTLARFQAHTTRSSQRCLAFVDDVRCSNPSLPLTRHCLTHICQDTNQSLFKPCQGSEEVPCNKPVPVKTALNLVYFPHFFVDLGEFFFPLPHWCVCEEIAVGMILVGRGWKRKKMGGGGGRGWNKRKGMEEEEKVGRKGWGSENEKKK
uniref:KAT8 regulatory NSL complex subunit 2 n=1 Tax=Zonotrichia albicollis TaxID=44394 RepID=A0A8D2QB55_ZONAL